MHTVAQYVDTNDRAPRRSPLAAHRPATRRRAAAAVACAGGIAALTLSVTAVPDAALASPATKSKAATVVQEVDRGTFGEILATVPGASLYENPAGCNKSCRTVWPALLMPKGTKVPMGAPDLGTAKLGYRLQVTYNDQRLYTFTGDSGTSVNGNGVAGFMVAEVTR